jgi:hypothetical protein
LSFSAGPNNPQAAAVRAEVRTPVAHVLLSSPSFPVSIDTLRLHVASAVRLPVDAYLHFELLEDVDQGGTLTAEDVLLAQGVPAEDGTVSFGGMSLDCSEGDLRHLLVIATVQYSSKLASAHSMLLFGVCFLGWRRRRRPERDGGVRQRGARRTWLPTALLVTFIGAALLASGAGAGCLSRVGFVDRSIENVRIAVTEIDDVTVPHGHGYLVDGLPVSGAKLSVFPWMN